MNALTPITVVFVRMLMLVQCGYFVILSKTTSNSLKRIGYKGQAWGALKVFTGEFKLTAEMLGSQLGYLNKLMMFCILMEIYDRLVKPILETLTK
jgi:hypothetical protein